MRGRWSRRQSERRRATGGGRRGRRAVARIEKLVVARAAVERTLDQRIAQAILQARTSGVPWPRIARALGATPRRARRRYRQPGRRT